MNGAEKLAMEDALWKALGKHVRQLRRALDLTQAALAKRSGLSEPIIRKIENHKDGTSHRRETLEKLSRGLGKEPGYLDHYKQTLQIFDSGDTPAPPPVSLAPQPQPQPQPELDPPSELERVVPRIDKLMAERLNKMVIPRLENMEKQVREIWDMFYESPVDVDMKHPPEPE
jgi:transcriptional regulator with XRE-family HTH domain